MMASLNHSSSPSSSAAAVSALRLVSGLMLVTRFTARPLRAPQNERRVRLRIDAQAHAAPLDGVFHAADQIDNVVRTVTCVRWTNFDIANMKPEFARAGPGERNRDGDRVAAFSRLLDEADDLGVVDLRKSQIGRLQ